MMNPCVTIVDYGVGNLCSVARALEHQGARVIVSDQAKQIQQAQRLLLPGVGAFSKAMNELINKRLVDAILEFHQTARPFLGICVGMQLLFSRSVEFGECMGFDFIKGVVNPLVKTNKSDPPLKLPHMGWSEITVHDQAAKPLLASFRRADIANYVYFAHSFACQPQDDSCIKASADYGDNQIAAIVQQGHLLGYQFHPEKSAERGLALLDYFLQL